MSSSKLICVLWICLFAYISVVKGDAQQCEPQNCKLPDCLCSGTDIPGGLDAEIVPQVVLLTFDDGVTTSNYPIFQEILNGRTNPNGYPAAATFFITHENTNYTLVHDLYSQGHEIGLHSISHQFDPSYWVFLNESGWKAELVDQRRQASLFAIIPEEGLKIMRAPFLQIGGDVMYKSLSDNGFSSDCSRPTLNFRTPGLWPYTNDYKSIQDCQIRPCPKESYPGFWTFPMIDSIGDDGFPCAMMDECLPRPNTTDETYSLIERNFLDQYNGNRAPFGIFIHSSWLEDRDRDKTGTQRLNGLIQFLDHIGQMRDVYMVSVSQSLEWVKNPVSAAEILAGYPAWEISPRTNQCNQRFNCMYNTEWGERYMGSCTFCPPKYPWVHNPLGD